jgi:hypothetical protein
MKFDENDVEELHQVTSTLNSLVSRGSLVTSLKFETNQGAVFKVTLKGGAYRFRQVK